MHIHIHIHVHIHMHIYMYIYDYIHTYIHTYIYIYTDKQAPHRTHARQQLGGQKAEGPARPSPKNPDKPANKADKDKQR